MITVRRNYFNWCVVNIELFYITIYIYSTIILQLISDFSFEINSFVSLHIINCSDSTSGKLSDFLSLPLAQFTNAKHDSNNNASNFLILFEGVITILNVTDIKAFDIKS